MEERIPWFRRSVLVSCLGIYTLMPGMASTAVAQGQLFGQSTDSGEPELIVELAEQKIYLGESVDYTVTLNHVDDPTPPELQGVDGLRVESLGSHPIHSRRTTIINGVRTDVVRNGFVYSYRLTPSRGGEFILPAPTASVDGTTLSGREVSLTVVPPSDQEIAILELSADHGSVYPMQPVTITATIAVRALPGTMFDADPTSVQPNPPKLDLPWFDSSQLPEAVEPTASIRDILNPIAERGRGFALNQVRPRSTFSLFKTEAITFRPNPRRTSRLGKDGEPRDYWEYSFKRTFVIDQAGTFTFGPVTLKGMFGTELRDTRLRGESIYAMADAIDVTVKPVPAENRPPHYIGAVGEYDIAASLTPVKAKVGDPLTLTLDIRGSGSMENARAPDLESVDAIRSSFRVYDATSEKVRGGRRFIYGLRPKHAGIEEFPAVEIAYFDVSQEAYVTKRSEPIRLTIAEAEQLTESDIVSAPDGSQTTSPGNVGPGSDQNMHSFGGADDLRNQAVQPSNWYLLWAAMIACYLGVAAVLAGWSRSRRNTASRRRRRAAARAKRALATARRLLEGGDRAAFLETLYSAVTGYVADQANLPADSLTPREAADVLERIGTDAELGSDVQQFLERCDAARFGAVDGSGAMDEPLEQMQSTAETIVDKLSGAMRRPKQAARTAACWIPLMIALTAGCAPAASSDIREQFQHAETTFSAAESEADYIRAANECKQILDRGFLSAAVLFHQGNAFLEAGEPGRAIAAYQLAKRYRPRNEAIDANLAAARQAAFGTTASPPAADWSDRILFWRELSGYRERFLLTTVVLAISLSLAIVYQVSSEGRRRVRPLFFLSLSAAILLMASVLWDTYDYRWTRHGVVVRDQVVARRGASISFEPALNEPLPEGTEFNVLGRRHDWIEVELGDSGVAWLPARDVVLF